jgi:hypothetical protein
MKIRLGGGGGGVELMEKITNAYTILVGWPERKIAMET